MMEKRDEKNIARTTKTKNDVIAFKIVNIRLHLGMYRYRELKIQQQ